MSKFKVGDRVTVRDDTRNRGTDYAKHIGKTGEVVAIEVVNTRGDDLLSIQFAAGEELAIMYSSRCDYASIMIRTGDLLTEKHFPDRVFRVSAVRGGQVEGLWVGSHRGASGPRIYDADMFVNTGHNGPFELGATVYWPDSLSAETPLRVTGYKFDDNKELMIGLCENTELGAKDMWLYNCHELTTTPPVKVFEPDFNVGDIVMLTLDGANTLFSALESALAVVLERHDHTINVLWLDHDANHQNNGWYNQDLFVIYRAASDTDRSEFVLEENEDVSDKFVLRDYDGEMVGPFETTVEAMYHLETQQLSMKPNSTVIARLVHPDKPK